MDEEKALIRLTSSQLRLFAWGLSLLVSILAILVWAQRLRWDFSGFNNYQLFPVFGLLAFSLMWSHYIASVVRQVAGVNKLVLKQYFEITSYGVLFFIFAHPGILAYQLARDGFGLPPASYFAFVGSGLAWAATIGLVAFMLFIAFEFRRQFADRPWWQYVLYGVDLAVVAIYFHALVLGSHVQGGWYRNIWLFYGVTLALAFAYIYWHKFMGHKSRTQL